jgi:hypothetical protein
MAKSLLPYSKVMTALKALGGDAGSIYLSLDRLHIRGRKSNPKSCPLACYLNRLFGNGWTVYEDHIERNGHGRIRLPNEFASFIRNFDNGNYSLLERKH